MYAGVDQVTKKRNDLVEFIPPGPKAEAQAEAATVRLVNQVNERRHPRTAATVSQLLDRYLRELRVARKSLWSCDGAGGAVEYGTAPAFRHGEAA